MKALVLVAHGSRRKASNEEVTSLTQKISEEMKEQYPVMEAGFLELAEPSIPEAIDRCVAKGATSIVVIPYFLSAGRHVQEDVPAEVQKSQDNHKQVTITLLPHIGGSAQMTSLIRGMVEA